MRQSTGMLDALLYAVLRNYLAEEEMNSVRIHFPS